MIIIIIKKRVLEMEGCITGANKESYALHMIFNLYSQTELLNQTGHYYREFCYLRHYT